MLEGGLVNRYFSILERRREGLFAEGNSPSRARHLAPYGRQGETCKDQGGKRHRHFHECSFAVFGEVDAGCNPAASSAVGACVCAGSRHVIRVCIALLPPGSVPQIHGAAQQYIEGDGCKHFVG